MNSISGPVPPQAKYGTVPDDDAFVAATDDAATGIAPARVTTNSQAIASYGGAAGAGPARGLVGQRVSYGWKICTPASPGVTTSTCATRNGPPELIVTEHCASIGGALPLGG